MAQFLEEVSRFSTLGIAGRDLTSSLLAYGKRGRAPYFLRQSPRLLLVSLTYNISSTM
jgi:hypothetical protein